MKSLVVTKEYRDSFLRAFITFKHQLVYCPLKRTQVRLHPPPPNVTQEQLRHAGLELDEDLAWQLALGNYDPFTFKQLHNFDPDNQPVRDVIHAFYYYLSYFLFIALILFWKCILIYRGSPFELIHGQIDKLQNTVVFGPKTIQWKRVGQPKRKKLNTYGQTL